MFEGNFPSTSPRGAYIWRGDLTEGFLRYEFGGGLYLEGLIHGGAYFREFYDITKAMATRTSKSNLIRLEKTTTTTLHAQHTFW